MLAFDDSEDSRSRYRRGASGERLRAGALLDHLAAQPGFREAALSCDPENIVVRRLYASLGLVETGEGVDDEIVARRPADNPTTRRST